MKNTTELIHPSMLAARQHSSRKERKEDGHFLCDLCDNRILHGTIGGFSNWRCRCKECKEAWNDSQVPYREGRTEQARANSAHHYKRRKEWIHSLKIGNKCADCPLECTEENYVVFDWDHLPGYEKKFNLAVRGNKSRQAILDEIAKCELVCSNCHRLRTHRRLSLPPIE